MAPARHNSSQLHPQLPTSTARKLFGLFSSSGDALLSSGLCYLLLTFYVSTVYVLVLALGGVTDESASVP